MQGGLGFTWSDFGSSEQRKRHVKPHPDRLQTQ
ncbi:cation diffusion facilitator family transporter [Kroppenstedtia eburnea]|nr:cation diffusion facilitator family transporter [Kroppenstedtia eburnea]